MMIVLIPDTRDSPKSPGSPHHESLGTQHIAVASANGIAARLSRVTLALLFIQRCSASHLQVLGFATTLSVTARLANLSH
jgi:hypothetical protein